MPGQPARVMRRHLSSLIPVLVLGLLAACGGGNPAGPSGTTPTVSGIAPATGTTLGGTVVSISGSNFATGAQVTIGGVAATNVTVTSGTTLTATTGQHAAGSADVVVNVGGRTARLPGAFTYMAPAQETNTSPVIQSIVPLGTRKNEPEGFADVDETIAVTATVTDKETPSDQLTYEWSADVGMVTGSGAKVQWQAPASGPTPLTATLTLTVIEKYQTTDASGLPVQQENRVTDTAKVSVHDSEKEVGDMATTFLVNFSKSSVPVDTVMKDFSPTCQGTEDERSDVEANRADFVITSWDVEPASVKVNFGGGCSTLHGLKPGDACSNSQVRWDSTKISSGEKTSVSGVDEIAAVYKSSRWWLCSSDFDGHLTSGARFEGWKKLLERR